MPFVLANSLQHYTTQAQAMDKVASTQEAPYAGDGAFGQPATVGGNDGNGEMYNLPASQTTVELSFYANMIAQYGKFIEFYTTTGVQCSFSIFSDGTCKFYLGQAAAGGIDTGAGNGKVLAGSASGVFQFNVQHHIYVRVDFSQTVGKFKLAIDGAVVIDTPANIDNCFQAAADCTQVRFFARGSSNVAQGKVSHIAFADSAGTVNGLQPRVTASFPTADGGDETGAQTGGVAGDAFSAVDEANPNDTDYIELDVGERNSFVFNAPAGAATVLAIQSVLRIKKTDADVVQVAPYVKIGGVRYYGTTVGVPADMAYLMYVWNQNPAGPAAWVIGDFPIEAGFERIT